MVSPTLSYLITRQGLDTAKIGKTESAGAGQATLAELQTTIARQQLIIHSLVMILLEKKIFDKDELARMIEKIDLLDGRADGKLTQDKSPVACPTCGRISPATAQRCQYCGKEIGAGILDRRAELDGKKNPPSPVEGGAAGDPGTHP
ncbi:zinc ribbon domain-containing protein [bacterium]|nr:zinc ribbon domain-containing protein [bacterium]